MIKQILSLLVTLALLSGVATAQIVATPPVASTTGATTATPSNSRVQDGTGTTLATVTTAGATVSSSSSTGLVTDSVQYGKNGSSLLPILVDASGNTTVIAYDSAGDAVKGITEAVSQGTGDLAVVLAPNTSGLAALSVSYTSTLGTTVFAADASPGNLYGVQFYNGAATVCYIQLFDLATGSVSLGSSVPVDVIPMPATSANYPTPTIPLRKYSTAISAASTTTPTGSTVCGTTTVAIFRFK